MGMMLNDLKHCKLQHKRAECNTLRKFVGVFFEEVITGRRAKIEGHFGSDGSKLAGSVIGNDCRFCSAWRRVRI
jgi:hypothetical protein